LYYDPARPTAFSTLRKIGVAVKKNNIKFEDIRDWLEKQDAYTLHRPIRMRYALNPYTMYNVMDVWEYDLVEVRALGKFNDKYKYVLSVIDVFSKYLHLVHLRSKTGTAVASEFISIFEDFNRRRSPVWVRTEKGKEFLNKHFQETLKRQSIQFQVCRNPDVKSRVAERCINISPTKNTYRYIDVLPKFVRAYNDTDHSAPGMEPSRKIYSDVLAIWKRMEAFASQRPSFALGNTCVSGRRRLNLPRTPSIILARRYFESRR